MPITYYAICPLIPKPTSTHRCLWLTIPGLLVINGLACIVGLVIFVHYTLLDCDPLRAKFIVSSNQVILLEDVGDIIKKKAKAKANI